jgi:hypothetical protein
VHRVLQRCRQPNPINCRAINFLLFPACYTKLLQLIDEGIEKTSRTGSHYGKLAKVRRKMLVMLTVVLTLAVGVLFLVTGTLTLPILRENTWCVLPVIIISALGIGHAILLFFTPSMGPKKKRQKQSAKVVAVGSAPVAAAAPGVTVVPADSEDTAQKTVFQIVVGCCSPSQLERVWYTKMRSEGFNRKTFAACLGLVVVLDILLPLFITGEASFGKAKVFLLVSACAPVCSLIILPLCCVFGDKFLH